MFGRVLQSRGGYCRAAGAAWGSEVSRTGTLERGRTRHPAGPAAGMLAEQAGQPTRGWKSGLLHISCTVGKCCHQLNKVEGRRERRSGKLREDCCFVLKTTSTMFFLNSILVQFCSDRFHYPLSTLRSIKYNSVFIPYEVLKLLIKYSI